jgi:subtilisin family serine protease
MLRTPLVTCSLLASVALGVAFSLAAPTALAQVELGAALRGLARAGTPGLPRALLRGSSGRVGVLAEYPADSGVSELLVAARYRPLWLEPDEIATFASDNPNVKLLWAPPRHTLLDQAGKWIGAIDFRNETGLSGKGVVVGIVDTGLDVAHALPARFLAPRSW